MISIEKCKEVLNKKKEKYNNNKVILIRDYLYQMAMIIDELNLMDDE